MCIQVVCALVALQLGIRKTADTAIRKVFSRDTLKLLLLRDKTRIQRPLLGLTDSLALLLNDSTKTPNCWNSHFRAASCTYSIP